LKGYWKDLHEVWEEWKDVQAQNILHRKGHANIEYEPLVFSKKPETLNEEKDKGDIGGARPLGIKTTKEELGDPKGRKESFNKEVAGKTYALEQILEPT
jgi:hypothetical protein